MVALVGWVVALVAWVVALVGWVVALVGWVVALVGWVVAFLAFVAGVVTEGTDAAGAAGLATELGAVPIETTGGKDGSGIGAVGVIVAVVGLLAGATVGVVTFEATGRVVATVRGHVVAVAGTVTALANGTVFTGTIVGGALFERVADPNGGAPGKDDPGVEGETDDVCIAFEGVVACGPRLRRCDGNATVEPTSTATVGPARDAPGLPDEIAIVGVVDTGGGGKSVCVASAAGTALSTDFVAGGREPSQIPSCVLEAISVDISRAARPPVTAITNAPTIQYLRWPRHVG